MRKIMRSLPTKRIEDFSDGVFGFALTLLIIAVAVPVLAPGTEHSLGSALIMLWPKVLVYLITSLIIGIFWIGHNIMFHYIYKNDRTVLFLNVVLLTFVCFIPFCADLLGKYPQTMAAALVYGTVLFLVSLQYLFIWLYAKHGGLVMPGLDARFIRRATKLVSLPPVLYAIATLLAFYNPNISLTLFILVPVLYAVPGPIDTILPLDSERTE